ncbi:MAG TPA: two-component regulator propeller domain-containing protein, partial [Chitinophagaceae bacterium]|nr:two-component regulator propeller domain-containing protein [Chitinophagaceae bacterium]
MKKLLLLLLLFISKCVVAQSPIPGYRLAAQRLPACFDELLKCNCIHQIFQDSKGFLWFATSLALIRFDGYDFKYFKNEPGNSKSVSHNHVYKIAEDKDGNIWVGLNQNGISKYDPIANEFTNYNVSSNDSSSEMAVESIFIDMNDEVWFSLGYSGLYHLNKKTNAFDNHKIVTRENCPHLTENSAHYSNYVMDMKDRDKNTLWLGTPEGLFIFDKRSGTSTPIRSKPVDTTKPADYNARRIIKDGDLLWIGGWASGMQSYNTKTGRWEQFLFSKQGRGIYTDNIIIDMAEKSADEIWVASSDRGFGVFNKHTKTTLFFSDDALYGYMPKTASHLIFQDRQQNVWTTFEKAFFKFSVQPDQIQAFKIASYKNQNNGGSSVNAVFEDISGRFVLAGTSFSDGIVVTDKK